MGKGQRDLSMGRLNGYELFLVERLLWGVVERRRGAWEWCDWVEQMVVRYVAVGGFAMLMALAIHMWRHSGEELGGGGSIVHAVFLSLFCVLMGPAMYRVFVVPYVAVRGRAWKLRKMLDEEMSDERIGELVGVKHSNDDLEFLGRIEDLKQWKWDCVLLVSFGLGSLLVGLCLGYLLISIVSAKLWMDDVFVSVHLGLGCSVFCVMGVGLSVLAWRVYKGSSVVVSEEGVRWRKRLWGHERDGFVEWGEVRGLYRVASEMGELVFYVLDGERDGLVWGVPRQVESEEEVAMERLVGVIVARVEVELRDITGVVQASLNERDFR